MTTTKDPRYSGEPADYYPSTHTCDECGSTFVTEGLDHPRAPSVEDLHDDDCPKVAGGDGE